MVVLLLDEVDSDVFQVFRRVLRDRAVQLFEVVVLQDAVLIVVHFMGESIVKTGTILAVQLVLIFAEFVELFALLVELGYPVIAVLVTAKNGV